MRIPALLISHVYGIYLIVKAKLIMSEIILNHIVEFRFNVGKKAKFWHSWLQGTAPRHLAPQLFNLMKRKNKTVKREL
jgi:hypothetical protein